MPVVDDRGRIGGRLNLVDATAAVVILVLIPVAYGAYLLFQTPPAKLLGIEPVTVYQGPNLRVAIKGRNLRPFMRVSFNTVQGRTFLIGSTADAQIDLPDLEPGAYDVVLFDNVREVDRLPKALTVLPHAPNPTLSMDVAGSFKQVADNIAAQLKVGTKFPPTGNPVAEIVGVGTRAPASLKIRAGEVTLGMPLPNQVEVPATLRVTCSAQNTPDGMLRCLAPGPQFPAAIAPDSLLTLAGPGGWIYFQISEVHLASRPQTIAARVRFIATPEILAQMKIGDIDASPNALAHGYGAVIVTLGATHAIATADAGARAPLGPVRIVDAAVRVPVEPAAVGWIYKDQPFKIGAPFTFETAGYVVRGEVSDVTLPPSNSIPQQ